MSFVARTTLFLAGVWVGASAMGLTLLVLVATGHRRKWIEYVVVFVDRQSHEELARRPLESAREVARN